jgi:hypothetical protein
MNTVLLIVERLAILWSVVFVARAVKECFYSSLVELRWRNNFPLFWSCIIVAWTLFGRVS